MNTRPIDARVGRIVDLFEHLQPDDLDRLGNFYSVDASFKDPFNDVCGVDAIRKVFGHMFDSLEQPRFVIVDAIAQGDQAFLSWVFHFRMRRLRRDGLTIRGASHLQFDADGKVCVHRDYWDAAEELYAKLPLLATLMRWLKRRAAG